MSAKEIMHDLFGPSAPSPGTRRTLYHLLSPAAKTIKALIQMLVGVGVTVTVTVSVCRQWHDLSALQIAALEPVGAGLAVAAAVELAYTLFTDGPDEALNPAMLALAGAIILQIATIEPFTLSRTGALILSVVALGGLFLIRQHLGEPVDRVRRVRADGRYRRQRGS